MEDIAKMADECMRDVDEDDDEDDVEDDEDLLVCAGASTCSIPFCVCVSSVTESKSSTAVQK